MARWPSLAVAVAIVVSAGARPCAAQEIVLTGPLASACPAISVRYRVPARLEWAYWLSSGVAIEGVGGRAPRASAFAAVGAEATAGVVQYVGCPAPAASPEARLHPRPSWRSSAYAELRAGPWVQAMTRAEGALVEGGMTLHLGTVDDAVATLFYTAPWGMWDVRVGGGYGAFRGGTSPEVALSLGWGYRFVLDRTTSGGACDPPPEPDRVADANLVRLVATIRHATSLPAWEGVIGIELTPTLALVPSRASRRRHRRRTDL